MRRFYSVITVLLALAAFSSCEKEPVDGGVTSEEGFELMISLPSVIDGGAGDVVSVKYYSGKGPKTGDVVVLKQGAKEITCEIVAIESDSFSFKIAPEVETGKYNFCIRRGNMTKAVRDVQFNIEKRVEVNPKDGYNLYGIITCGEEGVPGVVVADGLEGAVTDDNGIYYLKSK